MNEHSFIQAIHRRFPPISELYRWKIKADYQGGVADVYYSGYLDDLFVEYKYISDRRYPRRKETMIDIGLSPLQVDWGRSRLSEGRDYWVVVGSKQGSIILKDIRIDPLQLTNYPGPTPAMQDLLP